MDDKEILNSISRLKKAGLERVEMRLKLIEFIDDFNLEKQEKAILFGWGKNNYYTRIQQNIPDNKLIECVEKLLEVHKDDA